MADPIRTQIRDDCRTSLAALDNIAGQLNGRRIAVLGGTGFCGTWLAEAVALLNDEFDAGLRLDLYGRSARKWPERHPHLKRDDIVLHTADVRSSFELPRDANFVVYAAGIADPRTAASEPHRVFQTNVQGLDSALVAASRLERLERFVNVSSGLVAGAISPPGGLKEDDIGPLDFTRFHNLYVEARRAAESLACAFAGQYRLPLSTVRPFTFIGPYQQPDTPWAINTFIRDALEGYEIRMHGEGAARRSYLYGSDVAAWLLKICISGVDGAAYNLGGDEPLTLADAARAVAHRGAPGTHVVSKSRPQEDRRNLDFFPDLALIRRELGLHVTVDVAGAIERTLRWQAAVQKHDRLAPSAL